jgi:hypothetical protein
LPDDVVEDALFGAMSCVGALRTSAPHRVLSRHRTTRFESRGQAESHSHPGSQLPRQASRSPNQRILRLHFASSRDPILGLRSSARAGCPDSVTRGHRVRTPCRPQASRRRTRVTSALDRAAECGGSFSRSLIGVVGSRPQRISGQLGLSGGHGRCAH